MSSDLEREVDYIVKMILRHRKELKEWKPSPEYYKMLEMTRRQMEEAKKLGELVDKKLKALGEL
jgi:hypothetical protein